jgi:hypothetical protein
MTANKRCIPGICPQPGFLKKIEKAMMMKMEGRRYILNTNT